MGVASAGGMETTETHQVVTHTPAPVVSVPESRSVSDSESKGFGLKWGSIIGGTIAALAVGGLLYALGLALGLTAIDPSDPGSLKGSGIFTGIWSAIVPLIALFFGAYVAAKTAGAHTRGHGALHGLMTWGLTALLGAWLVGSAVAKIASGAASFGRDAGAMMFRGGPRGGPAGGNIAARLGLTSQDVVGPINQRLRAEGHPEVTAGQLDAATRGVVNQAIREGRIDRESLISALESNTSLSGADAREVAGKIESKFDAATADVREGALKAAESTGKAFWGVFTSLFLGLLAALAGGAVGSKIKEHRRTHRGVHRTGGGVTTTTTTTERERESVGGHRREAYP